MEFKDSIFYKILERDIPDVSVEPDGIKGHFSLVSQFISGIPVNLKDHAYAEGKWTIAQVLGHLVDTQTVFLYRILNIARGEKVKLPGFDENLWVASGNYQDYSLTGIKSAYEASAEHVKSTVFSLRKEDFAKKGEANGIIISVEEVILYLMAHEVHHLKTIKQRYLGEMPE